MYRGSRKHILDWTSRPDFPQQFENLIGMPECVVSYPAIWHPRGYSDPKEARLEECGAQFISGVNCWNDLSSWWLQHRRGANKPNWDLVVACDLWGIPGLALVEAKAHASELDWSGKRIQPYRSINSAENHQRIGMAIAEASAALNSVIPGVRISRDSHYQLANRVAYSWKLASMGVPVILVYLGFTGDRGISDVGPPIRDHAHWRSVIRCYTDGILPENFFDLWIPCGKAQMCMVARSLKVLEQSPTPARESPTA